MSSKPFPIFFSESDLLSADIKTLLETDCCRAINANDEETCFLNYNDESLSINLHLNNESLSFCVDFVAGKAKHRRQYGGGKKQPLAKACGIDKHPEWAILDATAGLGKDAFVLASLGADITLCEQHPALYALLTDGIYRASQDIDVAAIANRMKCVHHNSVDYLMSLDPSLLARPDVIYLDPMYPERKKSAKIKKEMQVLQHLVGHANDENELFVVALKAARHRVVVKRPKSAEALINSKPSYTVSSVNTRYDVYVKQPV